MASEVQQVNSRFIQDLYAKADGDGLKWSDEELLIIRASASLPSRVFMSGQPFQQTDVFICYIEEGSFDCVINLKDCHIEKGDLLVVTADSILQASGNAGDVQMQVVHISKELVGEIFSGKVPPLFHQRMTDVLFHLAGKEEKLVQSLLNSIWIAVHTDYKEVRNAELRNLLLLIREMLLRQNEIKTTSQPHNVQLFNRFIQLLNEHCEQHRDMDFYANELCLNKQYLGSVIAEVSHRKASSWIEEAVITRAKVLLRHDDVTVNEISEKLSFSEPSNLTRYFKRATGMTPLEYRNKA